MVKVRDSDIVAVLDGPQISRKILIASFGGDIQKCLTL